MENYMDIELPRLQALTEAKGHKKKALDDTPPAKSGVNKKAVDASTKQGNATKQGQGKGPAAGGKDKLVGKDAGGKNAALSRMVANVESKGKKAAPKSDDTKQGKGKGEKAGDPKGDPKAKKKMPW